MEKIIQITSGKGPEECERVVAKVVEKIMSEARSSQLEISLIDSVAGNMNGTLLSAMLLVKGKDIEPFTAKWEGTIQWISQSPYRKFHKRKNWFVGVIFHDISKDIKWNEKDISYQTMRSSGPGGQNVNKVESAVRATHIPTGVTVTASTERSQMMNKKEAVEKLKNKLMTFQIEKANERVQEQWMEHNTLLRGNPIRIFKERL